LGQVGDAGTEQFGVHALHGERAVRQELVGDLGGGVAVGAADEQQRPCRGGGHQGEGGGGDDGAPALGADEAARVVAAFRQQVLQRVSGHLPAEAVQFGADGREVAGGDGVEAVHEGAVGQAVGGGDPVGGDGAAAAVGGDDLQRGDVVGGGAPGHRVGTAGVVADHAAEGAPVAGGGVGAEGESVCGDGGVQG